MKTAQGKISAKKSFRYKRPPFLPTTMTNSRNVLPDRFREIVYDGETHVPKDIQEIRDKRTVEYYALIIKSIDTQKELWDLLGGFMKIHGKSFSRINVVLGEFLERHDELRKLER